MESLSYKNDRFEAGCSLYNQISSKLSSIINDFDSIVSNASEVESCKAGFMYDGAFKDMVVNIGNGLNELTGLLEKSNEAINNARTLVDDYNRGNTNEAEAISGLQVSKNISEYISEFNNMSFDNEEKIRYYDIYKDKYIPQGLSIIGDQVIISAYTKNGGTSRLYVYSSHDAEQPDFYVDLNNKAHVGGVTFDAKDKLLFVSDENGYVNVYDYEQLMLFGNEVKNKSKWSDKNQSCVDLNNVSVVENVWVKSNININEKISGKKHKSDYAASSVYYDNEDDKLYIVEFATDSRKKTGVFGHITVGDVAYDKKNKTYSYENKVYSESDSDIQGVGVYHDSKSSKKYMVEARSYGEDNNTHIVVRDITNGVSNSQVVGTSNLDTAYGEGFVIDKEGNVKLLHENENKIYRDKLKSEQGTTSFNIHNVIGKNPDAPIEVVTHGQTRDGKPIIYGGKRGLFDLPSVNYEDLAKNNSNKGGESI